MQVLPQWMLWSGMGAALVVVALGYVVLAQWATIKVPAAVVASQVIALTNDERQQNGVGQLAEDTLLDQAAQAKADDMAAKGYFSHVGPDGKQPWAWIAAAGYNYHWAGENLAVRFDDSQQLVSAWMASPTHRANIVKGQYTQIGIGVANGMYQGMPATFIVQFFGTPQSGFVEPSAVSKKVAPTPSQVATHATVPATPTATTSPAVAGAEIVVPDTTPTWWDNIVATLASIVHSLTASAVDSVPQVDIGGTGVSTVR